MTWWKTHLFPSTATKQLKDLKKPEPVKGHKACKGSQLGSNSRILELLYWHANNYRVASQMTYFLKMLSFFLFLRISLTKTFSSIHLHFLWLGTCNAREKKFNYLFNCWLHIKDRFVGFWENTLYGVLFSQKVKNMKYMEYDVFLETGNAMKLWLGDEVGSLIFFELHFMFLSRFKTWSRRKQWSHPFNQGPLNYTKKISPAFIFVWGHANVSSKLRQS